MAGDIGRRGKVPFVDFFFSNCELWVVIGRIFLDLGLYFWHKFFGVIVNGG